MLGFTIGRPSARIGVAVASAACVAAIVFGITGPASAGGATVTFSASVTLPAQPSSNFAGAQDEHGKSIQVLDIIDLVQKAL